MKKIPFLTNERLSRLMTSLLLCLGLLLPLMMTFGAQSALLQAVVTACVSLALITVLGAFKRGRLWVTLLVCGAAAVQFVLPGLGFFGRAFEAGKAIALYMNEVEGADALYAP